MNIKISTTNSKLGSQIPSISLPPQLSCRRDAPCSKGCYGKKGNFTFQTAQLSQMTNWAVLEREPQEYFNEIKEFLNDTLVTYKYFRWHTVGDIVDDNYLLGMIETAKKSKRVQFLCFTKQFDIVNKYLNQNKLPNNLVIVFSAWHKGFKVDNPHNLPVAYVNFKKAEMNPVIPVEAFHCPGNCAKCLKCWKLKKGESVYFDQH